jgi:hypothetical protein
MSKINLKALRLERNLRENDVECWDLRKENPRSTDYMKALEENYEADKWADERYLIF